ncbi:MAG: 2,3-bisphosphoglycerate-independent phosphoglycerate mutase [Salinivirgaceae bacterium]
MNKKTMLMILDGWGIGKKDKSDVIHNANTPNMDRLMKTYANAQLQASGENVGLPAGQMGNSEVGHLNIGAGRVVYQDLVKINLAVKDNSITENTEIQKAWKYAKENNKAIHFVGLVSDGGVHSSDKHLYKLAEMAHEAGIDKAYIHALTDGRDTDPKSGKGFMQNLQNAIQHTNVKVASIVGRYYGMDRDKRWERIKLAYDLYVHGKGEKHSDPVQAMQESYDNGVTDEFIKPIILTDDKNQPLATVQEGDVVFCFNFRTDRLRELTIVLTQQDMPEHEMKTMPLYYLTMTRYDDSFKNVHIPFDKDNLTDTMGAVLARSGKKQIRIAETEKYAHVTFFFSGGQEKEFEGEKRILVPSPKVATYDLQPEMSAYEVKDAIVEELKKAETDFVCLNFANGDMVGHTGVYEAIKKAVETVDECVGEVVDAATKSDYEVVIIADHGNADNAVNADDSPNTAHSLNAVPIIVVSDRYKKVQNGILADVAPTLLKMMGVEQPEIMTGKPLV